MGGSKERFIVIDPSPFISSERLIDIIGLLSIMETDFSSSQLNVILPSYLYDSLYSISNCKGPGYLTEIFKEWLPSSYSKDYVEQIVHGVMSDEQYLESLSRFWKEFNPISAQEHTKNLERTGGEPVYKSDVVNRLGRVVGEIVFELLGILHKLEAFMVSFGEKTIEYMTQFGVTVVRPTQHRYKSFFIHDCGSTYCSGCYLTLSFASGTPLDFHF